MASARDGDFDAVAYVRAARISGWGQNRRA